MIMMGLKFRGEVPFKQVFVHGLIQDAKGQKMSKSKGNILDPIDLIDGIALEDLVAKRTSGLMQPQMAKQIEKDTRKQYPQGIPSFGTDALRFTFCALASNNRHIRFDLARVEGYRNFCNKIWNAARYVMMNLENHSIGQNDAEREFSLYDKWIWSRLQKTKARVLEHIKLYRFDIAAQALYEFIWNEYCDWYLELAKPVLTQNTFSVKAQAGTRYTLIAILEELMRVLHPIMPFITEEIWQKLVPFFGKDKSPITIMNQPYPIVDNTLMNENIEQEVTTVQNFIIGIRNIRGEMNLSPSKLLTAIYRGSNSKSIATIISQQNIILNLARLENLQQLNANDPSPEAATAIVGDLEIFIPLAGLIDVEAESKRLLKEIEKLEKEKALYKKKLDNESYTQKAPSEIVQQERERLSQAEAALYKLRENYEKINPTIKPPTQ